VQRVNARLAFLVPRDKKYRYRSTIIGQAAQCDATTFSVTHLFVGSG
jgi:hypothetical protein